MSKQMSKPTARSRNSMSDLNAAFPRWADFALLAVFIVVCFAMGALLDRKSRTLARMEGQLGKARTAAAGAEKERVRLAKELTERKEFLAVVRITKQDFLDRMKLGQLLVIDPNQRTAFLWPHWHFHPDQMKPYPSWQLPALHKETGELVHGYLLWVDLAAAHGYRLGDRPVKEEEAETTRWERGKGVVTARMKDEGGMMK